MQASMEYDIPDPPRTFLASCRTTLATIRTYLATLRIDNKNDLNYITRIVWTKLFGNVSRVAWNVPDVTQNRYRYGT